jgi:hypothetical protein
MNNKIRNILIQYIPIVTIVWCIIMLLSLKTCWLNIFFFDSDNLHVQGIDYFALPKSFLNLKEGISMFDTWGGTPYGHYATWYLAHPAFGLFVCSWFAFFTPWTRYWLFVVFSFLLMVLSAWLMAKEATTISSKRLIWFLMLFGFPIFSMFYVGNMHAPLILVFTFIFLALHLFSQSINNQHNEKLATEYLMAGLLISFFSKPIVLLMLPLLLLLKKTRKATFSSLIIYGIVSLLFIVVPFLNPESIGFKNLIYLLSNPDLVKQHMNIYQNQFVLNAYMKDNCIHWFNLIPQSDYRLMHIDVVSFPVFFDTILGYSLNAGWYKLPIYRTFLLSFVIPFIKDTAIKYQLALLLLISISLTFFLSYNTVWEYQNASLAPVLGIFVLQYNRMVFYRRWVPLLLIICVISSLPNFYFLRRGKESSTISLFLMRFNHVVPVFVLFSILIFLIVTKVIATNLNHSKIG